MLSRVAATTFWINRYVERAENNARFLSVNFNLALDLPPSVTEQWKPLVLATGSWELFSSLYDQPSKQNVIDFMAFNRENPNSIFSCICTARDGAKGIRENLNTETWQQVNQLYLYIQEGSKQKRRVTKDPRAFFEDIRKNIQLLFGIGDSTIARTEGWYLSKLGQLLERADNTSRILDVKYHVLLPSLDSVGSPVDLIHWAALLKSVSAYNMYRMLYGKLEPLSIVEYLVLNRRFPRSILFCLMEAEHALRSISGNFHTAFSNDAEKRLGMLRSDLEFLEVSEIMDQGLHEYIDRMQMRISKVSDAIYETYFAAKF